MAARERIRSRRSVATSTYVALLRGINVGGKHKISMKELGGIFAQSGCADVRTYIQSGNVVFTATPQCAKRISSQVSDHINTRFGFRSAVVVRSIDELSEVALSNPFLDSSASRDWLHVAFLAESPDPTRIAALDPKHSPGDAFELRGSEIYLCLPNGVARSKLTNAYFDSKLATTSTLRNWRTVLKLLEIAQTCEQDR